MYAKTAKQALRKIVDESVDLIRSPAGKTLKPGERNKLVDRIVFELWMRGFAISGRTRGLRSGFSRDDHDAWRKRKLNLPEPATQSDVESSPKKPPEGVPGYGDAPAA